MSGSLTSPRPGRARRRAERPTAPGAARSARRNRDVVAEAERLLLLVVQLLPRLDALVRLRVAAARLGAWAVGLVDPPDPAVARARERLVATQLHAANAGAAIAASR